jgi:hypothetical protein
MINIIKNFEFWTTNKYSFCYRNQYTGEVIDSVDAVSRLSAAKFFAARKQLTLKEFLKIFIISK